MIPSFNIEKTKRFFTDILHFRTGMESEHYAILHKDNLTIHILRAGEDIGQMEFYLEVDKLDDLWNSIKAKVKMIRHRAPFDREYGMREIHIHVPETNTLLFIGEETGRKNKSSRI